MTDDQSDSLLEDNGWEHVSSRKTGILDGWRHIDHNDEIVSTACALSILSLRQDRDTQEGEKIKYKEAVEKKVHAVRHYREKTKYLLQRIVQIITFLDKGDHSNAKRVLIQSLASTDDVEG